MPHPFARRRVCSHTLALAVVATCALAAAFQQPAGAQSSLAAKPAWRQEPTKVAKGPAKSVAEIRAFMDDYLRMHAAKDMTNWVKTFLPEATIVRTADDGQVILYTPAQLAKSIADEAVKLDSQHETFEDIVIDVEGDAASYGGTWRLFHNGKELRNGRAWYTLVKRNGKWVIASLVWYRRAGGGVR